MQLILLPGMLCDAAFWQAQSEALADICEPLVPSFGSLDNFDAMAEAVLAGAPERFALRRPFDGRTRRAGGVPPARRSASRGSHSSPPTIAAISMTTRARRRLARRDAMLAKTDAEGMHGFARMWVEQVVASDKLSDATLVAAIVGMISRHSRAICAAQTLAGLMRRDQADVLAQIRCPTLVCAGSEDTLRPVAVHRDMAARSWGAGWSSSAMPRTWSRWNVPPTSRRRCGVGYPRLGGGTFQRVREL